jgi:hypothetical protein
MWEPSIGVKLSNYEIQEKEEIEIDVENIFRYTSISEKQVKDNIDNMLKEKNEAYLEEVLENYPVNYSLDEFMTYIKVAIFDKHEISKQNISNFKIK